MILWVNIKMYFVIYVCVLVCIYIGYAESIWVFIMDIYYEYFGFRGKLLCLYIVELFLFIKENMVEVKCFFV